MSSPSLPEAQSGAATTGRTSGSAATAHSPSSPAPNTVSSASARLMAPRRNHTISSPGRRALNARRLAEHFEEPAPEDAAVEQSAAAASAKSSDEPPATPTSPGTNSLRAIMGAADDEHDWERMIRSDGPLPEEPARSSFSHDDELVGTQSHSRGSSSNAFSPTLSDLALAGGAAGVRRHQSLNHAPGHRLTGHRLQTRASDLFAHAASLSSASAARAQGAASPHSTPGSGPTSPIGPSGPAAPWQSSNSNANAASPYGAGAPISPAGSRFARSFSPRVGSDDAAYAAAAAAAAAEDLPSGATSLSTSLMDAHARLARMTLDTGGLSMSTAGRADSTDSGRTLGLADQGPITPTTPNAETARAPPKRLPSLITNRDVLARAAGGATQQGPVSAAAYVPPIGHAHARAQSSDSPVFQMPSRGGGASHGNASAAAASRVAALSGPFSAMPEIGGAGASWRDWGPASAASAAASRPWEGQSSGVPPSPGTYGGGIGLGMGFGASPGQWGLDAGGASPSIGSAADNAAAAQAHAQNMALSLALAQQQARTAAILAGVASPQMGNAQPAFGSVPNAFTQQAQQIQAQIAHAQAQAHAAALMAHVQQTQARGGGDLRSVDSGMYGAAQPLQQQQQQQQQPQGPPPLSPEVQALIAARGFNPPVFDLNPPAARWFVIKSFTEDDVQRSLKHEIWASTEKGNARLDKAYRESAHLGPLFLFFSVNASGHFNGMAQMLTPLDYTTSSDVWAQEGKWKGTFKLRWIYVKDVPNSVLRHIRLTNTPENKPVTQSRDTQELPTVAGREIMRIMHEYVARTTLLQDWAFYEQQQQQQQSGANEGQQGGAQPPTYVSPSIPQTNVPPRSMASPRPPAYTHNNNNGMNNHGSANANKAFSPRQNQSPLPASNAAWKQGTLS